MLKKIKSQENYIMIFFLVVLAIVGIYVFFERNIVDIFYFIMMVFFFFRFLIIRRSGR